MSDFRPCKVPSWLADADAALAWVDEHFWDDEWSFGADEYHWSSEDAGWLCKWAGAVCRQGYADVCRGFVSPPRGRIYVDNLGVYWSSRCHRISVWGWFPKEHPAEVLDAADRGRFVEVSEGQYSDASPPHKGQGKEVVLKARVAARDIDWGRTAMARAVFPGEEEIALKVGAPVELLAVGDTLLRPPIQGSTGAGKWGGKWRP